MLPVCNLYATYVGPQKGRDFRYGAHHPHAQESHTNALCESEHRNSVSPYVMGIRILRMSTYSGSCQCVTGVPQEVEAEVYLCTG
ncbi:uncharacterized protein PHACADRAFT_246809 [Phanerochaete carnosa HHB-10118-sp]|uniref:Uncharacterized protein n=1 Tax=Phanerochaete carnosa (strain HHB-10118-sp) TaxID=650164 RepID=K5XCK2_PHACS|nr:uncharacterized protein PHACADRAFT_246809 [Phanerochaete carnosa HHB-10118-sp]EKM60722.1 hypothetical protein PHACADRAFT_246809 [Phanerochaete carnosa HHB-10118-sp]